jgi:signal transduction histidine kinase
LKNSLQALSGIAQLLALDYAIMPREELKKYLEIIANGGRKSLNIVDELLVLASVRQQEITLEPLNMAKIIEDAHQRVLHMAEASRAQITIPDRWPPACGYSPWIEEVWVNYLSNAIKYGGEPPIIVLGSTPEQNMVRFWIADNGPGIAPKAQGQLFAPFTQLAGVSIKGHGLGLSIVRRIVNKLGGEVGVHSEGVPGKGSTFSFTLPSGAR